ncbi:MAG: DNA repair protein RadC [Bacteroidales bacterium]|nr:DNA repair protein RadC [Candidatus Scybalocola fimicaballi]
MTLRLVTAKNETEEQDDFWQGNTKDSSLKNLDKETLPREKFLSSGADALSNAELLAILVGSGTPGQNVIELCEEIMNDSENKIGVLAKKGVNYLCRFKGIGPAKALTIAAAMELASRRRREVDIYRKVKSSTDLYESFAPGLQDSLSEEVHIAFIDGAGQIRKIECISKGSFDCSLLDVRIVVTKTLLGGYTTIALAHNHPSGYASPSTADIQSTREILRGCQMMRIRLIDHIIIANNEYYSFADNEKLEEI